MKIVISNKPGRQGTILLASMVIVAILGITLASFLVMIQNQSVSNFRSQSWNNSIALTEAGLEDGMEMINKYSGTSVDPRTWTNSAVADGWDSPVASLYHVQRTIGSDYYDVYITNLPSGPVLRAEGTVNFNYHFNTNQYAAWLPQTMFAAAGVNVSSTPPPVHRAVVAMTKSSSGFTGAILTKKGIVLSGAMVINSFNSQDPSLSTSGHYDTNKFSDGADVGTIESNVVAAVSESGGADVYGHVATGPNSTATTSSTSAMGSKSWIQGGGIGIQPGWFRNDLNVVIPDASAGTTVPLAFPSSGNYTSNGVPYKYWLTTGTYYAPSSGFDPHGNILVTGQVAFYSTNLTISGSEFIYVATNSSLTCYLYGNNVAITGGGAVNATGFATNCAFVGLPSCTKLTYSGSSDYIGTIYAPQAAVTISGGAGVIGALVATSLNISGSGGFHYDESLGGLISGSFYRLISWSEVNPSGN